MSHVLSDVMGCHRYDLRIVRHLQQPRQDPGGGKRMGGKFTQLKKNNMKRLQKRKFHWSTVLDLRWLERVCVITHIVGDKRS